MNLRELHIPGNLHEDSLEFMSNFPPSLTHLGIGNNPRLTVPLLHFLLQKLGFQLESLEIQHSWILFGEYSLDEILPYLPVLRRLRIPAEHISAGFFKCATELMSRDPSPLVELELTCSKGEPNCENESVIIDSNDVWGTVVNGGLGRLRRLKIHRNLEWDLSREARSDLKSLDDMLRTLAREDAEASGSHKTIEAGVWLIGKKSPG